MLNAKKVAFVVTDPQVEFLKPAGKGFGATKDILEKVNTVNTIDNLTKLFALAKERGYKRFISPHYFFPHDHR
jgi:amidohydrolase